MYISEIDKERILQRSEKKLLEVIGQFAQLEKKGADYKCICPSCGRPSLSVNVSKSLFKCFSCNEVRGTRPIDFLMSGPKMTFPEALKWLADHFGVILEDKPIIAKAVKPAKKRKTDHLLDSSSYCAKMLSESGLSIEDVIANVCQKVDDNNTLFQAHTFAKGTITERGEIDKAGDDVIIRYYDLDGFPCTYIPKIQSSKKEILTPREFFRIRWQYPEEHKDKNGKPTKYRTPPGASPFIYIPEKIRFAYRNKQTIERLYIQEGEKKAEKACKHGIMSVGISGIQNLGYDGKLPESIATIVSVCQVREVVFMLDSDCFDLTSHLKINEPIEKRPKNFFNAVKNFREYFKALKNRNIYVELYFGHVLKNEKEDKGIDDLLANTLQGKESELLEDINTAMNLKDMVGKYVRVHKITTIADSKLMEIWSLHSHKEFCKKYYDELRHLPEFMFGKHRWRFDEETKEIISAQPLESDEMFWSENRKSDKYGYEKITYDFRYASCFRFLQNRGFGRYRTKDDSFIFVKIEHPFVRTVSHTDTRDFLVEFAQSNANEDILEMIYRGGPQYLGPDKLSYLDYIQPAFEKPTRDRHHIYFLNQVMEITPLGITSLNYTQIQHHVWMDARKRFDATILPDLFVAKKDDKGVFDIQLTELGSKCHFLRFLQNTSNFTWRKNPEDITTEEHQENMQHFIAKLCAIGYLANSYKDSSVAKAVVAVDGKQSEVGDSNGRSGKSLIGGLLQRTAVTQYINGKVVDAAKDQFVWSEITEKTKIVFIDDVKRDFNFELIFANITGDWSINQKGGGRFTIEYKDSPKIYLTTNHMLSGEGSSFMDRQWIIAFSDFYNEKHKPEHDFGFRFFDEWDPVQWNLTWNMIAQCVKLYFQLGCIESPGERIELRKLRQDLSEEFILWADEYYSDDSHRNTRIARKVLYDSLFESIGLHRQKFYTPVSFKKKIRKYCQYRELLYNPHKYDKNTGLPISLDKDGKPNDDDKSGGIEYFMVADSSYNPAMLENEIEDTLNTPLDDEL